MNRLICFYLIFLAFASNISCRDKKASINNRLVIETVEDFLQTVVEGFKLDSAVFIHVEYRDLITSFPAGVLQEDIKQPEYKEILKLLDQKMRDPTSISLKRIDKGNLTIVGEADDTQHFFRNTLFFIFDGRPTLKRKLIFVKRYLGGFCHQGTNARRKHK